LAYLPPRVRSLQLSPPRVRTVSKGEVIELEAWRDVAEWRPVSNVAFAAVLATPPQHHAHWIYDRETRKPHELVSASFDLNRIVYALELLAEIGDASAAPAVAALYEHSAHHVRWAAIKATVDLDASTGKELLRRAADDPHPHVAKAARAGLQALEDT
jgi:hypothetical protein